MIRIGRVIAGICIGLGLLCADSYGQAGASRSPNNILAQLGVKGVITSGGTTNHANYILRTDASGKLDVSVIPTIALSGGTPLTGVIVVDAIGGTDGAPATGAFTQPYQTLAYALSVAPDPVTIVLAPGTYTAPTLTAGMPTEVTLQGWDAQNTHINGTWTFDMPSDVVMTVDQVRMDSIRQQQAQDIEITLQHAAIAGSITRQYPASPSSVLTLYRGADATLTTPISTANAADILTTASDEVGYAPSQPLYWPTDTDNVFLALEHLGESVDNMGTNTPEFGVSIALALTNTVSFDQAYNHAPNVYMSFQGRQDELSQHEIFDINAGGFSYSIQGAGGLLTGATSMWFAVSSNTAAMSGGLDPSAAAAWASFPALQTVDMNNFGLTNVAAATVPTAAPNWWQVTNFVGDTTGGPYLPLAGGVMAGTIDMDGGTISDLLLLDGYYNDLTFENILELKATTILGDDETARIQLQSGVGGVAIDQIEMNADNVHFLIKHGLGGIFGEDSFVWSDTDAVTNWMTLGRGALDLHGFTAITNVPLATSATNAPNWGQVTNYVGDTIAAGSFLPLTAGSGSPLTGRLYADQGIISRSASPVGWNVFSGGIILDEDLYWRFDEGDSPDRLQLARSTDGLGWGTMLEVDATRIYLNELGAINTVGGINIYDHMDWRGNYVTNASHMYFQGGSVLHLGGYGELNLSFPMFRDSSLYPSFDWENRQLFSDAAAPTVSIDYNLKQLFDDAGLEVLSWGGGGQALVSGGAPMLTWDERTLNTAVGDWYLSNNTSPTNRLLSYGTITNLIGGSLGAYLPLAGGTMTGDIIGLSVAGFGTVSSNATTGTQIVNYQTTTNLLADYVPIQSNFVYLSAGDDPQTAFNAATDGTTFVLEQGTYNIADLADTLIHDDVTFVCYGTNAVITGGQLRLQCVNTTFENITFNNSLVGRNNNDADPTTNILRNCTFIDPPGGGNGGFPYNAGGVSGSYMYWIIEDCMYDSYEWIGYAGSDDTTVVRLLNTEIDGLEYIDRILKYEGGGSFNNGFTDEYPLVVRIGTEHDFSSRAIAYMNSNVVFTLDAGVIRDDGTASDSVTLADGVSFVGQGVGATKLDLFAEGANNATKISISALQGISNVVFSGMTVLQTGPGTAFMLQHNAPGGRSVMTYKDIVWDYEMRMFNAGGQLDVELDGCTIPDLDSSALAGFPVAGTGTNTVVIRGGLYETSVTNVYNGVYTYDNSDLPTAISAAPGASTLLDHEVESHSGAARVITFNETFSTAPAVTITVAENIGFQVTVEITGITTTTCTYLLRSGTGAEIGSHQISWIAVGSP